MGSWGGYIPTGTGYTRIRRGGVHPHGLDARPHAWRDLLRRLLRMPPSRHDTRPVDDARGLRDARSPVPAGSTVNRDGRKAGAPTTGVTGHVRSARTSPKSAVELASCCAGREARAAAQARASPRARSSGEWPVRTSANGGALVVPDRAGNARRAAAGTLV